MLVPTLDELFTNTKSEEINVSIRIKNNMLKDVSIILYK